MLKAPSKPCIRCGKERIVSKTWTDVIGTSKVTFTNYVCPDSECQAVVEEEFNKKKTHLANIQAKSLERKKQNKRNKKTGKKAKK
jgi:hypothetical protein